MSKQVQKRRGTSSEHANFTGAVAEITVDTETNELVLGDGVTQGGRRVGISRVTTSDLINSVVKYPQDDVIETCGFTTAGDGGAGKWKQNGVTGQTPSQTPAQLNNALLNDANGNQWEAVRKGRLHLSSLGAGLGGDDTSNIIAWLNAAGQLFAGDGVYLVDQNGPNAGGAYVDLLKDTDVKCSDGAVFKAGQDLDNDLIRLEVPDGPKSGMLKVKWDGGVIDQRLQKNSTSIPFSANYPGVNPGSSATTDGLSIIGVYIDGTQKQGIKKTTVTGVHFVASNDKWQSAGGDSGLNVASETDIVFNNDFYGCRDLGVYHSSDSLNNTGLGLASSFKCYGNTFKNCMFGVSSKRGADNGNIYGNTFVNCIQSVAIEPFNKRSNCFSIFGNTINGYIFAIDIGSTDGVCVTSNTIINAGVLLEDNSVPTVNFTNPEAIVLKGSLDCSITGNTIKSKIPEFSGNSCEGIVLKPQDTGAGIIESDDNLITNNIIKNIDVPFYSLNLLNNSVEMNKVSGTSDNTWNMSLKELKQRDGGELTIQSGVININSSIHNVDTESASPTDDLDTISGGSEGFRLILMANNSGRTVVLKDLTGNLQLNGDFQMTNRADRIELLYDENTDFWYELSRSDNQA